MTILNNHESCYSHFSINLVLGVGLEVGLLVPDVHGEAEDDRGGGEPGGRHPGQGRVTAGGRQSARHHQPHPSLACALYCPRHTLQQPGRSCAHARTGRKQPHHGPGPSLTVLSSGQVFVPRPAVTIHLLATLCWSCVLLCSPLKIPLLLLVTVSGCRCVVWRGDGGRGCTAAARGCRRLYTLHWHNLWSQSAPTLPTHFTPSARTQVAALLHLAFQ